MVLLIDSLHGTAPHFSGDAKYIGPARAPAGGVPRRSMTGKHDFSTGRLQARRPAVDVSVQQMMGELSRAKAELVASISRDVRIPLIVLLGPLQEILDSPASALAPTSRSVLESARRNALKLLETLETLPDVPGIDSGDDSHQPIDLAAFTAELADDFRALCDAAGLRLVVDCPRLEGRVAVNPAAWERIVLNLVANAYKATVEGTIEVRLRVQGGHALLIVSDTGAGIAETDLPYVFNHVNRAVPPRGGMSERIGVGLAFVRDLVQQQRGSIDVRSTPGSGTTITVRVPLEERDGAGSAGDSAAVEREAPQRQAAAAVDLSSARGHVVIVEDHAETREYLQHVLEAAGFTV